jgi:K+-transporting ATPase ATPase A chain
VLDIVFVLAIIAILYRPLGDYMAAVYSSPKDRKFEHGIYRLIGVDPRSAQTWQYYLRAVLAFSAVSVLLLLLLQRTQAALPFALGLPAVPDSFPAQRPRHWCHGGAQILRHRCPYRRTWPPVAASPCPG